MASFNKVLLIGNLTRDPETRQTNGGQSVVAFGLAVSRQYLTARNEQREEVLFVDVEAWGRTGEVVAQYCRKGNPLFVEGRLKFDQWQDRDTGARRSRLSVTAESIQLLGAPNRGAGYGEESAGGQQPYQPAPQGGAFGAVPPPQQPGAPLPALLASLAAQRTRYRFEAVLVDDGSRDGTAELLRRCAGAHPDWQVRFQPGGGAASARNTGRRVSRGR